MHAYFVVTTINLPVVLEDYAENIEKYGHKEKAAFLVIGDLKTPEAAGEVVARIRGKGFDAEYWDIPRQEAWLKKLPSLNSHVPYNSDYRRNVGFLLAYERGAEIIIAIDDDNYPTNDDYLAGHAIVGTSPRLDQVESSLGWYNVCAWLQTDPSRTIYPRGFPYSKRYTPTKETFSCSEERIVINAGLWLNDPDVDAVTRLAEPVRSVAFTGRQIALAPGTYTPINCQNTAFHRDLLPCYQYIPMAENVRGRRLDRYGDIWQGFFAKKIVDQLGDRVSFGFPLVDHRRNSHNLLKDLEVELEGMILTEYLVRILEQITLSEREYASAYIELAQSLRSFTQADPKLDAAPKDYFRRMTEMMERWVDACTKLTRC